MLKQTGGQLVQEAWCCDVRVKCCIEYGGLRSGLRDLSGCKTGWLMTSSDTTSASLQIDVCGWPSLCIAQPLNDLHGRGSKLWLTAGALQEQPRSNGRAHGRELQCAGGPIRGAIELQQQAGSMSAGHATSRLASRNTVDRRVLNHPLPNAFKC